MGKRASSSSAPRVELQRRICGLLDELTDRRPDTRVNKPAWLRSSTIVGLGLGERLANGVVVPGEDTLTIYVRRKLPNARIRHPVPKQIPTAGGIVETDIVGTGDFCLDAFSGEIRPARPGCSIGHEMGPYGTLGAIVRSRSDGKLCLLSCSHVLAPHNRATEGDWISQPAPADGGGSEARIARLQAWQRLHFDSGYSNTADAAIATVLDESEVDGSLLELNFTPSKVGRVERGDEIRFVGRTSSLRSGRVLSTVFSFRPRYRTDLGWRRLGFREQVLCTHYATHGDSGGIVFNEQDEIVGMHIASSSSHCVFTPIDAVFAAVDVELA